MPTPQNGQTHSNNSSAAAYKDSVFVENMSAIWSFDKIPVISLNKYNNK